MPNSGHPFRLQFRTKHNFLIYTKLTYSVKFLSNYYIISITEKGRNYSCYVLCAFVII